MTNYNNFKNFTTYNNIGTITVEFDNMHTFHNILRAVNEVYLQDTSKFNYSTNVHPYKKIKQNND